MFDCTPCLHAVKLFRNDRNSNFPCYEIFGRVSKMSKEKVFIFIGIALIGITGGLFPIQTHAQAPEELQTQIADLQRKIQELQTKLLTIRDTKRLENAFPGIPVYFTFEKRLELSHVNSDVQYLQIILNSDPDTRLASTGPGSPGKETNKFGPLTKAAVIKFQEKYSDEILAPWKFTRGTGIVGPTTRKMLNAQLPSAQAAAPIELITPTRDFEGIEKWYAGIPNDFIFGKRLESGQVNSDVKYLQIILNTYLDTSVALVGPGSLRKETNKFGPLTKTAVIKFQEKFSDEVLNPWKLKKGTGIVGPSTRNVLNLLLTSNRSFPLNEVEQGDTLVVVTKSISETAPVGTFKSRGVDFMKVPDSEKWVGVVGIGIREEPGVYPFVLTLPDGSGIQKDITVRKKIFPRTVLQISSDLMQRGYTPTNIAQTILGKENVSFGEVFKIYTPTAYFNQEFILPLDEIKIVGGYGNIRKQGEVALRHLGVDFGVPTGTPVYAVNDGVVRYTKESTNYGKAVLIDHGLGIYSAYLHLDEFQAADGQQVKRGDIIGLSGNTGYSLAPHVHFSIRTTEGSVDPLRFIDAVNKAICSSSCSEAILTFGLKVLIPSPLTIP